MELMTFLKHSGNLQDYQKGDIIFRQGESNEYIYFIKKGLLKAFYTTPDGREFVKSFLAEQDFIDSLTSLMQEDGCSFSLICLEPTSLIAIKYEKILHLIQNDLAIANTFIQNLFKLSMKKEQREFEFLCLTAEQRYQLMKQRSPDIVRRVTQNDIARYLGITPVALSRIRSRINKNSQ